MFLLCFDIGSIENGYQFSDCFGLSLGIRFTRTTLLKIDRCFHPPALTRSFELRSELKLRSSDLCKS